MTGYKVRHQRASYTLDSEVKVLRTVHKISFWEGSDAGSLAKIIQQYVPPEAKVIDWSDGDSETGEDPYIRFEVEKQSKVKSPTTNNTDKKED